MDNFVLISRNGMFHVNDSVTPVEQIPEGCDVVIDPSLTFRKNFEVPGTVDRDEEKIKLQVFSRFLPEDIDQFTCQFMAKAEDQSEKTRVCGLGIRTEKLNNIKNQLATNQEVYFLEALLENPFPGQRTELSVSLPEGRLLAQFSSDFLVWSNFLDDNEDQHVYRPGFLPESDNTVELPEFPETPEDRSDPSWRDEFTRCLRTDPPGDLSLLNRLYRSIWDRWENTAHLTVVLMVVTALVWTGVQHYANSIRRNWLHEEYRKLTGETSETPYRTLREKVSRLESEMDTTESPQPQTPLYPVIPKVDSILGDRDIHLLTLDLSRRSLEFAFLSPSLENAEQFRNDLEAIHIVTSASINNSSTLSDDTYRYEINLSSQLDLN